LAQTDGASRARDPEATRDTSATYVAPEALRAFMAEAFATCGLPPADAAEVAGLMVQADLTGSDAHGVFRLAQYVQWLQNGTINPRATLRIAERAPATAVVDGDNGMGHLAAAFAARTAVEIARETGVAWVGARNSNHAGAAAGYAAIPVEHGMVGIYAAASGANHMVMWGGSEPLLGTNPIAVGIPAGDEPPVMLDIATSVSSFGVIKTYAMQGKPLPEGWMINRSDGTPLTDPKRVAEGALLPIGGYKGSGLALAIGLLAGPLNRAAFGRDVRDFSAEASGPSNTGQFVIALDIARFIDPALFAREVDRHLRDLRGSQPLPGIEEIRIPGQGRQRRKEQRLREGVPLKPGLIAQLDTLASSLGLRRLTERQA
jgi:L-2-hydroxycarboxylate dehydrogenase (NAD+)